MRYIEDCRRRSVRSRIAATLLAAMAAIVCRQTAVAQHLDRPASRSPQAAQHQMQASATLPPHITLPLVLVHTIDTRHAKVGQPILGKLVQHVQIGTNAWLPKGALVHGRILALNPTRTAGGGPSSGPSVTFKFCRVTSKDSAWKVKTSMLAVASLMEVFDATEPAENFDDRGNNNEHAWTMRQIGGDMVYHDSGLITDRYGQKVGTEDTAGNYSLPVADPDSGTQLPRALGLFSTTAKGVYGMPGYAIANTEKTGTITISAAPDAKHVELHYAISMQLETQP